MRRTSILSACLGNFFEHFDAALFGFLSLFLAPLIFPKEDAATALLFTYGLIPIGMIARPLGALFFGKIGDRFGSSKALSFSLFYMGVISVLMAFIPMHSHVGIASAILFCLGRFFQNFLSAGEAMGGAIFLLEHSSDKRHDFLSSLYNATTVGGVLLASFGVTVLSHFQIVAEGWRALYLFGAITAFFGWKVRKNLPVESKSIQINYSFKTFFSYRKPLFEIILISGFAYANYSISLIFMNGFVPLITSFSKETMSSLNTILLIFDFSILPLFGYLASRIGRERMMLSTALITCLCAPILFSFLPQASLVGIIAIRTCFVIFGVAFFAPFHAYAKDLVPKEYRYSLISFGYAVGSQLIGGPTAALSLWAFQKTGIAMSSAWYLSVLALISTIVLYRKTVHDRISVAIK